MKKKIEMKFVVPFSFFRSFSYGSREWTNGKIDFFMAYGCGDKSENCLITLFNLCFDTLNVN
jgi:hypothetical protein